MRTPKPTRALLAALVALGGLATLSNAQSVTTTPVGAINVTAAASADTHLAVTLTRPAAYKGTIVSVAGNALSLSGANFTTDQLKYSAGIQSNTYYLQITSGTKAGHYSTVTTNSAQQVTCEFEEDILSGIAAGDQVAIYPYWTLGTLFPSAQAGTSFVASTSNFASGRRTEILFPNISGTGINRAPNLTYFYNSFWRQVGSTTDNRNDVIILPDTYLLVRGNNYVNNTSLTYIGEVKTTPTTVALLATSGSTYNDNPVGVIIPANTQLQNLNLVGAGLPFVTSTSNFTSGRGDELLVYENAAAIQNKAPTITYYYNSFWRKVGDTSVNQNTTTLPAGAAILIRKKPTSVATVTDWAIPAPQL